VTAGTRLLAAAIRGYRRWLSGRGPLRRVRCTFAHGESCSTFGLRAAHEAPDAWTALGRIRRRLRRCGGASVFALSAPDGSRALGWGDDHERPLDELCAELDADGERPVDRATVLAGRELVSRWRGDLGDVAALAARRRALPHAHVILRRPPAAGRMAAALAWRALLALVAVATAWWLAGWVAPSAAPIAAAAVAATSLLGLGAKAHGHAARHAHLAAQARAALLRDRAGSPAARLSAAAPR
jgi:putative component of membrane protein insertase Oxa1/YidC/SpoIIIJ protein YidD